MGLPPAWVDDSEEIVANIQRARVKMSELVKLHAKALMPSFGDGKEDQHQIETLTQEVTTLLRKSEMKLKRLSAASGSSEDSNVRKNVQVIIIEVYVAMWTVFYSILLFFFWLRFTTIVLMVDRDVSPILVFLKVGQGGERM